MKCGFSIGSLGRGSETHGAPRATISRPHAGCSACAHVLFSLLGAACIFLLSLPAAHATALDATAKSASKALRLRLTKIESLLAPYRHHEEGNGLLLRDAARWPDVASEEVRLSIAGLHLDDLRGSVSDIELQLRDSRVSGDLRNRCTAPEPHYPVFLLAFYLSRL